MHSIFSQVAAGNRSSLLNGYCIWCYAFDLDEKVLQVDSDEGKFVETRTEIMSQP